MLKIEGKTFMNIQEAVQWLLENNALPFQCTANYAPLTEIGLGTIVNPTPAKVRIGSLIFFADSKVSTVVGITENGFICSDRYNNLVDDVAYVTNVTINASGHLITTFSDGQTQDAGLIKQVSGFSINSSQHLVVTYNDGTSSDLGAIFNGNISISGNLSVTGSISGPSIIEDMGGDYSFTKYDEPTNMTREFVYAGIVKNGNKLTIAIAINFTRTGTNGGAVRFGYFTLPGDVATKIYPTNIGGNNYVALKQVELWQDGDTDPKKVRVACTLSGANLIITSVDTAGFNDLTLNQKYYVRYELTLLLSDNMAI